MDDGWWMMDDGWWMMDDDWWAKWEGKHKVKRRRRWRYCTRTLLSAVPGRPWVVLVSHLLHHSGGSDYPIWTCPAQSSGKHIIRMLLPIFHNYLRGFSLLHKPTERLQATHADCEFSQKTVPKIQGNKVYTLSYYRQGSILDVSISEREVDKVRGSR